MLSNAVCFVPAAVTISVLHRDTASCGNYRTHRAVAMAYCSYAVCDRHEPRLLANAILLRLMQLRFCC